MMSDTINKLTPNNKAAVLVFLFFSHNSVLKAPMLDRVIAYPLTGNVSVVSLVPNNFIVMAK